MVSAVFNHVPGYTCSENISKPYSSLCLRGNILMTKEGLEIAEMVSDEDGELFWKPLNGSNDSAFVFREIELVGVGKY